MNDPLWKRLRDLDWKATGISDKDARNVQKLLQDLSSHKEARAMKASQKLWTLLKPPAKYGSLIKPFLQEIHRISTSAVKREINDLLGRIQP
ncbi:hypothetical protein OAG53_02340 [Akkermansiaceae bacterium]|nr:hypothetical protein [Akkermansiaceae bacterium]